MRAHLWRYLPPPGYALIALGIGHLVDRLLPVSVDLSNPWVALLLAGLGIGLDLSALAVFLLQRTTPLPLGVPTRLVILGPYRYTRNPMYLGLLSLLLAAGFYFGGLGYFVAAPVFFAIVNGLFIPFEEARLAAIFGDDFDAWKCRTRRWL